MSIQQEVRLRQVEAECARLAKELFELREYYERLKALEPKKDPKK